MNYYMFFAVIFATFMTINPTSVYAGHASGELCPGVKYTHNNDSTWTVNNHGAVSTWGTGYTWQDLHDTFC